VWSALSVRVPGYRGHQTRAALARLNDEAGGVLPEAFFHYAAGRAIPDAQAPIRMLGDGRQVRILGVGTEGMALLYANAAAAARLLIRANPGTRPQWQLREGSFEVRSLPYRVPVSVRAMVAPLPARVRPALVESRTRDPALVAAVEAALGHHIGRQIAWLTPDAPTPQIANLRIELSVPVAVKAHRFWPALDLSFEVNARFVGPWQLGRLQARGYGRLAHARRAARSA
jgi:hypothetical protein